MGRHFTWLALAGVVPVVLLCVTFYSCRGPTADNGTHRTAVLCRNAREPAGSVEPVGQAHITLVPRDPLNSYWVSVPGPEWDTQIEVTDGVALIGNGDSQHLIAVDLQAGGVLWSHEITPDRSVAWLGSGAGRFFFPDLLKEGSGEGWGLHLLAVDPGTGRRLWSAPTGDYGLSTRPVYAAGSQMVFFGTAPATGPGAGAEDWGSHPPGLHGVRASDGRLVWFNEGPVVWDVVDDIAVGDERVYCVFTRHLVAFRQKDGKADWLESLPSAPESPHRSGRLALEGPRVLVSWGDQIAAFSRDTGRCLWAVSLPKGELTDPSVLPTATAGRFLLAVQSTEHGSAPQRVLGIDVASGAEVWRTSDVAPQGLTRLVTDGRFLVYRPRGRPSELALLDIPSGRLAKRWKFEGVAHFCGDPGLDRHRLIALHVRDDRGLYLGIIDLAKELGKGS